MLVSVVLMVVVRVHHRTPAQALCPRLGATSAAPGWTGSSAGDSRLGLTAPSKSATNPGAVRARAARGPPFRECHMAAPGFGVFGLTRDLAIDGLTHGYYWRLGPDGLDWSMSNGFFGQSWSPLARDVVEAVLSTFSYYTNVRFNYIGYYERPTVAAAAGSELNFALAGTEIFASPSYWGYAGFPIAAGNRLYPGDSGDVFINQWSSAASTSYVGPGTATFSLLIHEVGHALGLKHTHDDGGTGRPTWASFGFGGVDKDWMSVMSYRDDAQWNTIQWDPATPMALDVIALQYLYGRNMAANAGDSIITLKRTGSYGTVWDASGSDTVDASAQNEGWNIALPDWQPSTLVDTRVGLAIPIADSGQPYPSTLFWLTGDIEHANGSQGTDRITGNWLANNLRGGGGNDFLDGAGGVDTAWFSAGQYRIQRAGSTVTLTGPDGVDTLSNIERIRVGDLKYALDIDGAGGQAYRLYQAAFNRTPDAPGLGFQIGELDRGVSLQQVAGNFIASSEFQRTYGALDNAAFVTQLYANVLHRAPDGGGLNFHTGNLTAGMSRAAVLVGFSESPENQAALLGVTANGMLYA